MAEVQRVLGGRYLLKDKVGNGGMASVYRAQDRCSTARWQSRSCCPNTLAMPRSRRASSRRLRLRPDCRALYRGRIRLGQGRRHVLHRHGVPTRHRSQERRAHHGALNPKKSPKLASQICGALSVAHKHEIIHRDIKPQNIMVLPDGNIKVMDFGIARAKNSHLTQDNNVLGTAHYVSPEQTRGQELGPHERHLLPRRGDVRVRYRPRSL